MQLGTRILTLLLLTFATVLRCGAQSTVFAYTGQLADGGVAPTGVYDFQFRLADASVAGNYVCSTVTCSPVLVSNGSFVASIDFGSAVFDGSARWLEMSVRTNGGTTYTVLSPRQPITATPYAIFAGNAAKAASVSGTIPASQLSGVLSSAQLPTSVLTNGAADATLSGTFSGDLSAGTNLPAGGLRSYTLGSNQLDNATWAMLVSANIDSYSNLNRYAWTRTAAKLQTNAPVTFLFYGNGWLIGDYVNQPMLSLFYLLRNYHPQAGVDVFDGSFDPAGTTTVVNSTTNWAMNHYYLNQAGDTVTEWNPFYSDTHALYYVTTDDGGTFKVQTNQNGGAWQDLPAPFNAVNVRHAAGQPNVGSVLCWTDAAPSTLSIRVVSTGVGHTPILGYRHWNSHLAAQGGLELALISETGGPNTSKASNSVTAPIFAYINPDMIMNIGGQDLYPWTMLYGMYDLFRTNTPNADVVLGGMFPLTTYASSPPFPTLDANNVALNALTSAYCASNGWAYFDGHSPFGSYDNLVARGLSLGDPTNPHLTDEGYGRYNQFLWAWLNLLNTPVGPASSIVYTSPEISLAPSLAMTALNHNLGYLPRLFRAVLRCKLSDAASGLPAGAEIPIEFTTDTSAGGPGYAVAATPAQFILKGPSSSSNVRVGTAAASGGAAANMSNFRLVIYATK